MRGYFFRTSMEMLTPTMVAACESMDSIFNRWDLATAAVLSRTPSMTRVRVFALCACMSKMACLWVPSAAMDTSRCDATTRSMMDPTSSIRAVGRRMIAQIGLASPRTDAGATPELAVSCWHARMVCSCTVERMKRA